MILEKIKGFTLIEILIVIGIIILLSFIGFRTLLEYKKTVDLDSFALGVESLFIQARTQTLSSVDSLQYGVHIESSQTVLFRGVVFTSGDPGNKVLNTPTSLEISNISLKGGGNEVVFKRLNGETNEYGTVVIRLKSDISRTRNIIIEKTGVVSVN